MANSRPRGSSLFSGLALLFVGILLLLHNYRGFRIGYVLGHWWPLILIFWGAIKLYERSAAVRSGEPGSARISGGEIALVVGLLSLLGIVVAIGSWKQHFPGSFDDWGMGNSISIDLEGPSPLTVPSDARIAIRNSHGDITVRPSEEPQIRVSGKKNVKAWNERDAEHLAAAVSVEVVK